MINFPGLGLSFNFSPIAFTLFGRDIYWYGFIVATAIFDILSANRIKPPYNVCGSFALGARRFMTAI